jgi:hypothetical protein
MIYGTGGVCGDVIELMLMRGARRATRYISPTEVVKATRRHKPRKSDRTTEMVVTVGRPNYAEREFIKRCKKSGEPLPVNKIHLEFYAKKGK